MCGIFGSTNFDKFITLYNLNKKRGTFAYGGLFFSKGRFCISSRTYDNIPLRNVHRYKGIINIKEKPTQEYDLYLGHTQAPTSSQRSWTKKTSHPFAYNNWIVAHNGVLSNWEKISSTPLIVDSMVIPQLLSMVPCDNETDSIKETFSQLEGTFSCWIFNKDTNNSFLVRSGSTLFIDQDSNFSSVEFDNSIPLEEGVIWNINKKQQMSTFKTNKQFFIA